MYKICKICGAMMDEGDLFCDSCGSKLEEQAEENLVDEWKAQFDSLEERIKGCKKHTELLSIKANLAEVPMDEHDKRILNDEVNNKICALLPERIAQCIALDGFIQIRKDIIELEISQEKKDELMDGLYDRIREIYKKELAIYKKYSSTPGDNFAAVIYCIIKIVIAFLLYRFLPWHTIGFIFKILGYFYCVMLLASIWFFVRGLFIPKRLKEQIAIVRELIDNGFRQLREEEEKGI